MISAIRALAWKEWREQRPVVVTGLALSAAMPLFLVAGASTTQKRIDLATLADTLPVFLAALVWPLLTAACGAGTIANEAGDGTLGFLLSRPVSRLRVWLVKIGIGGLAALLIISGSLGVAAVFGLVAKGQGADHVLSSLGVLGEKRIVGNFTLLSLGAAVFLLFATSVFFSTFLSRALTAAAAGLAASLGLISSIFLIWWRLDIIPRFEPELLAAELGVAGLLTLAASLYVFARGEMLSGRSLLRKTLLASLGILAGFMCFGLPVFYVQTRLSAAAAQLSDMSVSPRGNGVLATASGPDGVSSQVWLVHADGSGMQRLTGRLALNPSFDAEGQWIAYLSLRGPLGLRSSESSLRAMRADGSSDRLLAAGLPIPGPHAVDPHQIRFSPRGDRVALAWWSRLVVAAADGSGSVIRDLSEPFGFGSIAGWTRDGSEIVLVSAPWRQNRGTRLVALDPDTGSLREIYETESRAIYTRRTGSSVAGISSWPLVFGDGESETGERRFRQVLIDVEQGSARTIAASACAGPIDLSRDGKTVAYAFCRSEGEFEVHLGTPDGATDVHVATLPGIPLRILLSPSADRVVIERFSRVSALRPTVTVDRQGNLREFDDGWAALGWSGRSGVILTDGTRRLAVGNADTGELRPLHP